MKARIFFGVFCLMGSLSAMEQKTQEIGQSEQQKDTNQSEAGSEGSFAQKVTETLDKYSIPQLGKAGTIALFGVVTAAFVGSFVYAGKQLGALVSSLRSVDQVHGALNRADASENRSYFLEYQEFLERLCYIGDPFRRFLQEEKENLKRDPFCFVDFVGNVDFPLNHEFKYAELLHQLNQQEEDQLLKFLKKEQEEYLLEKFELLGGKDDLREKVAQIVLKPEILTTDYDIKNKPALGDVFLVVDARKIKFDAYESLVQSRRTKE